MQQGKVPCGTAVHYGSPSQEASELRLDGARAAVYAYLAAQTEPVTALDVAEATGHVRPTIWNALKHLEERGLAARSYKQLSGHGRTPDLWSVTDPPPLG
ncbi:helix-turn-helix domain-containing protein [Streptomyces sp. NPDC051561]|uniref:helix-turn-helix domain-containing protein n=1 Tax=Streptomyces sp. NPDC051561 TaxID=3365658 RepID=UPI0037B0D11F